MHLRQELLVAHTKFSLYCAAQIQACSETHHAFSPQDSIVHKLLCVAIQVIHFLWQSLYNELLTPLLILSPPNHLPHDLQCHPMHSGGQDHGVRVETEGADERNGELKKKKKQENIRLRK